MPQTGKDYPGSYAELLAWFPDEAACCDYLEWLRWPDEVPLPEVRRPGWVAVEQPSLGVRGLRASGFGHGGNDLSPHSYAAAAVVRGGVGDDQPEARRLRARYPAVVGAGVLPDGVGDAAPLPVGDGATGRERLAGHVEVDEAYLGGVEGGVFGRQTDTKAIVAIAVEVKHPGVSGGSDCNASTTSPSTA